MLTPAHARAELAAALADRVAIDFIPQAPGHRSEAVRHSAVLVLFGALDDRDATTSVAADRVSAALDVLLIRRSRSLRHHAGEIAFPGGGREPQDRAADGSYPAAVTALREAAEETGLDPAGVEVLGELPEIYIPVSKNLVTPVVGWWTKPSEVRADSQESVEVFRVPVGELLDPNNRGRSVFTSRHGTFRAPCFRLGEEFGGHIVWGFTGMLLSSLFQHLGWALPWSPDREYPV